MFSRMGSAAFKKDLTNIRKLCTALGEPHTKFKSIHVGGTNGKGSVSHMLAALYQTAGYKTGLHTSPHLYDFRERIKVNGEMIPEADVVEFVERLIPRIEEIKPSFFEITVAMTFEYFARQKVDVAIIEVGLGGRLDSTNIITPELSVITNIGWDHMNMLGDSLEAIAFEKAGIIKEGTPVVIGEKKNETNPVFEKLAKEKRAPLFFAEDRFKVLESIPGSRFISTTVLDNESKTSASYKVDLPGIYQSKNLLTFLQAVSVLNNNKLTVAIERALGNVKALTGLHGRWEVIQHEPTIVLEVAHNKDGIEQMLKHLGYLSYKTLHIVMGTVNDKDLASVLSILPPDAKYYFTRANIPRALEAELLQQTASQFFLTGNHYPDVNVALEEARKNSTPDDIIIVCGSIFLVAEVNRNVFSTA